MGADFSFGLDGKQESRNIDVDYILDLEMRERKTAQIMAISENISISFSFHPLGNLFRPFSFHQKKKKDEAFLDDCHVLIQLLVYNTAAMAASSFLLFLSIS